MIARLGVLFGLLAAAVLGAQQPAPPPDAAKTAAAPGAISGTITDAVTGRPIPGAAVLLRPGDRDAGVPSAEMADSKGRFVFTDLAAPAQYTVLAFRTGYFRQSYGQNAAQSGAPVALPAGGWFAHADISLQPFGSISGSVTDERGEPVAGVIVRVLSQIFAAGLPQLAAGPVTKTDDRGVYRIPGLTAGRYIVHVPSVQSTVLASDSPQRPVASPSPLTQPTPSLVPIGADNRLVLGPYPTAPPATGAARVYPGTFFPDSAAVTSASPIELSSGENRGRVDIQLKAMRAFRITGHLIGPPAAVNDLVVRLIPEGSEALGIGAEAATSMSTSKGTFLFVNVPEGRYTLLASRETAQFGQRLDISLLDSLLISLPAAPGSMFSRQTNSPIGPAVGNTFISTRLSVGDTSYAGTTRVVVGDGDISDFTVTMRPTATIAGSIVWDGNIPDTWRSTGLHLEPALGNLALFSEAGTGGDDVQTFSFAGLMDGDYMLRARTGAGGTAVKSIVWNGRDYTETPFTAVAGASISNVVVTLTPNAPVLEGNVLRRRSRAGIETGVVAFPLERERWSGYGLTPARIKTAPVSATGAYRIDGLPAGSYCVIAVDAPQLDKWQDAAWLESASALATRVSLAWGEHRSVDLSVVTLK